MKVTGCGGRRRRWITTGSARLGRPVPPQRVHSLIWLPDRHHLATSRRHGEGHVLRGAGAAKTLATVSLNPEGEEGHHSGVDRLERLHRAPDGDPLPLRQALIGTLIGLGEINGNRRAIVSQEHELRAGDPLKVTVKPEPPTILLGGREVPMAGARSGSRRAPALCAARCLLSSRWTGDASHQVSRSRSPGRRPSACWARSMRLHDSASPAGPARRPGSAREGQDASGRRWRRARSAGSLHRLPNGALAWFP